MSKKKYYAVAKGREPGIYEEWFGAGGAETQIKGFPGAVYKGFLTRDEATDWLKQFTDERQPKGKKTRGNGHERAQPRARTNAPACEPPYGAALEEGKVIIYTDGGCIRNPGPGGYGAVILYRNKREELSGGYKRTTNNRMELMACIKGLEHIDEGSTVVLYSDSQYVVNGIQKGWARRWQANDWKRNDTETAENIDLWSQLLDLCENRIVQFVWLKGHAGITENERCDRLSSEMAHRDDLPPDSGFEKRV